MRVELVFVGAGLKPAWPQVDRTSIVDAALLRNGTLVALGMTSPKHGWLKTCAYASSHGFRLVPERLGAAPDYPISLVAAKITKALAKIRLHTRA